MDYKKTILGKTLTFLLLAVVTFGMVSCGGDDEGDDAALSPEAEFYGTWKLAGTGSLAVGPSAGSSEWWSIDAASVTLRACAFDDTYTFAEGGKFTINLGNETWLEPWQGVTEGCGAPKAPHVSGEYAFSVSADKATLKVIGQGAFIGLAKVNNVGELGTAQAPATIPSETTFRVTSKTANAMTLQIEAGNGVHWTFKLAKQ